MTPKPVNQMNDSKTRTALVTGATRGIGKEVARQLAAAGFKLFISGRDEKLLNSLLQELGCTGLATDLTAPIAPVDLFSRAREALGRVEVLVNNAGFNRSKEPITSLTADDLDTSYAVNVRAPILLAREALREMSPRHSGHIVNVISSIVHVKMENYSVYTAMKHALHGFTGCLIKEARQLGIKVTAAYPGGVNTTFRSVSRPDYLRPESAAQMIVQCILAPEDVVVHDITYRPMVESNF